MTTAITTRDMPHLDPETGKKLAGSLTALSTAIIPYLPYLLIDLWELGTSPAMVCDLVRRHIPDASKRRFLDLGCGKGAVSVALAKEFAAMVTGIDAFPDFIAYAGQQAARSGVSELCHFRVGNITKDIHREQGYDCVVLGAVGDVLGPPRDAVRLLRQTVIPGGFIIIDDGYVSDPDAQVAYKNYAYPTREEWLEVFAAHDLCVIEEQEADDGQAESNASDLEKIRSRANELCVKFPEHKKLFESYVAAQTAECRDLESVVTGVLWLLRT
jgi:SAM-dependent methyltransferase